MLQSTDNAPRPQFTPSTLNPVAPVKTVTSPIEQATIGRSLVIKGEISGSESLYVDGRIEGTIIDPGDAAVAAARIGSLLDAVLSVEEVGVYKPHRQVYQLAVDRLGVPAEAIAFQSSNAWDAYAASAFGMKVVWCNRYGQKRERLPGAPDFEIKSLAELPALVGAP